MEAQIDRVVQNIPYADVQVKATYVEFCRLVIACLRIAGGPCVNERAIPNLRLLALVENGPTAIAL